MYNVTTTTTKLELSTCLSVLKSTISPSIVCMLEGGWADECVYARHWEGGGYFGTFDRADFMHGYVL